MTLPVLMAATNCEIRVGDAVDRLAEQLGLTADERSQLLPCGKQTLFGNRIHWTKTYVTKAGLLVSTRRGNSRITDRRQTVLVSA